MCIEEYYEDEVEFEPDDDEIVFAPFKPYYPQVPFEGKRLSFATPEKTPIYMKYNVKWSIDDYDSNENIPKSPTRKTSRSTSPKKRGRDSVSSSPSKRVKTNSLSPVKNNDIGQNPLDNSTKHQLVEVDNDYPPNLMKQFLQNKDLPSDDKIFNLSPKQNNINIPQPVTPIQSSIPDIKTPVKVGNVNLHDLNINQLRNILKENHMTIKGSKLELVDRIAHTKDIVISITESDIQASLLKRKNRGRLPKTPVKTDNNDKVEHPKVVKRKTPSKPPKTPIQGTRNSERIAARLKTVEKEKDDDDDEQPQNVSVEVATTTEEEKKDYNSMSVRYLKKLLIECGLPTDGKKDELIRRLEANDKEPQEDKTNKANETTEENKIDINENTNYESMTREQLHDILTSKGLKTTGKKNELIERLKADNNDKKEDNYSSMTVYELSIIIIIK